MPCSACRRHITSVGRSSYDALDTIVQRLLCQPLHLALAIVGHVTGCGKDDMSLMSDAILRCRMHWHQNRPDWTGLQTAKDSSSVCEHVKDECCTESSRVS